MRRRRHRSPEILKTVGVGKVPRSKVKLPRRSNKDKYDDQASLKQMNFVGERY
jgi:polyphosphate kinase